MRGDRGRHRLLIVVGLTGLILGARSLDLSHAAPLAVSADEPLDVTVRRNVARLLAEQRGLHVRNPVSDVAWIRRPGDFGLSDSFDPHVFVALAAPAPGAPRDVYRLEARVSPSATVWSLGWVVNLSRTDEADDNQLVGEGTRVATAVRWAGRIAAIEVRDLAGEDTAVSGVVDWTFWQRQGDRITNLERTGQAAGVDLRHYTVTGEAPTDVELALQDGQLQVLAAGAPVPLRELPRERKMPMQLLNWVADRGRGFADQGLAPVWLGSGVELMKEVYFTAKEVKADVQEMAEEVAGPEERAEAEAPEVVEEALELARLQARQTSFPWPPAPLEPMLDERLQGEGMWVPFGADELDPTPNAPPPLYHTFLRPTTRYRRKVVRIFAWDPRHLQLQMRAGTREPIPQTAHRGDGRIPRDPELISRVVAAFNGGFQTTHTTFGMMVDDKLLLHPRSYGATVALMEDGRTAIGTWQRGAPIPDEMVSFRQNLQPLIEDGVYNAYHRKRFGAHQDVAGAKDGWTVRSALCTTPRGVLMYLYAEYANEKTLGDTILQAGCTYAIHLDMNWGHTGFELYRRLRPDEVPADPEAVREVAGLHLQGSTPHPNIRHMNRPTRYLGVDYRDFFYLVRRPMVPGPDLDAPGGAGRWLVERLPHNDDFPPRIAWTTVPAGEGRLELLQLDPSATRYSWLTAAEAASDVERDRLVASLPLAAFASGRAAVRVGDVLLRGRPLEVTDPSLDERLPAATVVGLDQHGFLWVTRVLGASLGDALRLLSARGVREPIWSPAQEQDATFVYQATRTAGGAPALLELLPGDQQGVVVDFPSDADRRVLVHAIPRADRVIRLWPHANPWKYDAP